MKTTLWLCFIVAVQAIGPETLQLALETAFVTDDLDNQTINNVSSTAIRRQRSNRLSYSEVVYKFLDRTYKCGSEKSKKMASDLMSTVEAVAQLPILEYFITDATKVNTINAIERCANVTLPKKPRFRKIKSDIKKRAKKTDSFFTGAIDDSVATQETEEKIVVSKTQKLKPIKRPEKFRAIIDQIIDGKDEKIDEGSNQKLVKIILEIGDNLKSELSKNRELRAATFGDNKEGVLSFNNVAFRTNEHPNSLDDTDIENSRADSEKSSDDETPDLRREGDDIVLNNNMEIFVKMNKEV
ncbi:uncharacterized protein [Battus philenor]|uniref:uncharacterized protein n=1 Tax=Battus philenor TaxID=42288 RepID=UPI0035D07E3C